MKVFEIRTETSRGLKDPVYEAQIDVVVGALKNWLEMDKTGIGTIRILDLDEEEYQKRRAAGRYQVRA